MTAQEEMAIQDNPGTPLGALTLYAEIKRGQMKSHGSFSLGQGYQAEIKEGVDSLYLIIRCDTGGFALRVAYLPGPALSVKLVREQEQEWELAAHTSLGAYRITIRCPEAGVPLVHCTTTITPETDVLLPFWPRDLYPIGSLAQPDRICGKVEAAQRGLNAGLLYMKLQEPNCGSLLYFQNLTVLNDYYVATETKPDGVVGGDWPELGYKMPICETKPLPGGKETTLSDAYLNFAREQSEDERRTAHLFLDLLAGLYRHLDRPPSEFHPWPTLAQETLRDLANSPKATLREHGYLYLHPYTDSEYPDSMVQLTVLMALREYARWRRTSFPLIDELRKGVRNFYDVGLGTIRRYLISVGEDKDADEVDSWYLYHPLVNLGRLAQEKEDEEAKELFLGSLAFAIKVAQHFEYTWPVQFNVETLEVIKQNRKPGDPGQSDVGGLYAHIMLQAHELTGETLYLEEAKKAIHATEEMQFELTYQTNITAYGIVSCLWLWRLTGESFYQEQSYVFLASYFHNCVIWDSQIDRAKHYLHFLAATCLHDGPYMSPYECSESFAAFHHYLEIGGNDLPESVVLLLTEFCKYALGRVWHFYPEHLPKDALATEICNGQIDRLLAFPLEDLYADGQPAGQVGQEVYGAGAAFVMTTRAFYRMEKTPFLLYCEYPCYDLKERPGALDFSVRGSERFSCRVRLIATDEPAFPVTLQTEKGKTLPGHLTEEGHCEFIVPAGQRLTIHWGAAG